MNVKPIPDCSILKGKAEREQELAISEGLLAEEKEVYRLSVGTENELRKELADYKAASQSEERWHDWAQGTIDRMAKELAEAHTELKQWQETAYTSKDPFWLAANKIKQERDDLRARLDALEVRLPCGHRKADMDDSYGECVFCKFRQGYEEYEKEVLTITARLEKAEANLKEARHFIYTHTVSGNDGFKDYGCHQCVGYDIGTNFICQYHQALAAEKEPPNAK